MKSTLAFSCSAYEDEDLQDIRASMERLLQEEEDDLIRSSSDFGAGDFNGNPPEVRELFSRLAAEMDRNSNGMAVDDDEDDEEEGEEEEEDEDDEQEEGEGEECSNGSPGDEEQSNNGRLNEEWHSGMTDIYTKTSKIYRLLKSKLLRCKPLNPSWPTDGSGEDQSAEAVFQDSIFSRLEELRFNLEQKMGFEKFIEAYNKIKVFPRRSALSAPQAKPAERNQSSGVCICYFKGDARR